jgi:hypothetical protein
MIGTDWEWVRRGEQKVNDERKSIGEIRSDDQRRRRV